MGLARLSRRGLQGQRQGSSPHPEAEAPADELAILQETVASEGGTLRVDFLAQLPNDGDPPSGGTRRRSSEVTIIGPIGPVLDFSFAAALISVRNRSKDLRRSIIVDGEARPDTASNASSATAQQIRRLPSRISKRMSPEPRGETALDVVLIMDTLTIVAARFFEQSGLDGSFVRTFEPPRAELANLLRPADPSGAAMPEQLTRHGCSVRWHEVHVIRPKT
jgi:hypothetical protein